MRTFLNCAKQEAPRGGAAGGGELVRAVLGQAAGSVLAAQAVLGRAESVENGRDGEGVPGGHRTRSRSSGRVRHDVDPWSRVNEVVHPCSCAALTPFAERHCLRRLAAALQRAGDGPSQPRRRAIDRRGKLAVRVLHPDAAPRGEAGLH